MEGEGMYYGLIRVSVLMFGGGFALQDVYRKMRGSGLRFSMESLFIGSSAGAFVGFGRVPWNACAVRDPDLKIREIQEVCCETNRK